MKKPNITNQITPCCKLPFSTVYWWVTNLTLNSPSDREFILNHIYQDGCISIDAWKVLVNSGTLESDAVLTKAEFLAWFNCGRQPSCDQLKLLIEGYKISNYSPEDQYGKGWTEIGNFENYNDKVIRKITNYVGGVGVMPSELSDNIGKYYAASGGYTNNKDLATDFKPEIPIVVEDEFDNVLYNKSGSEITGISADPDWPVVGMAIDSNGLSFQNKGIVLNFQTNLNRRFLELNLTLQTNSIFYVGTKNAEVSVGQNTGFINCQTGKIRINDLFNSGTVEKNIPFAIVSGRSYIVRFYKIDNITKLELIDGVTAESVSVELSQLGHFDKYRFGVDEATNVTVKSIKVYSMYKERPFIGFYGDSNTEGNNVSDSSKIPYYKDRFANMIGDKIGKEYFVSARSGGNIDGVLARVQNELPVLKPKYVFVTIGTNGGNTEAKLNQLVDYCESLGIKVILNLIPLTDSESVTRNTMIQNVVTQRNLLSVKMNFATSVNYDGVTKNNSLFISENGIYLHLNVDGNKSVFNRSLLDLAFLYDENGFVKDKIETISAGSLNVINAVNNGLISGATVSDSVRALNTNIINNLIVTLISRGGGKILIPTGDYCVNQIVIPDVQKWVNIEIEGEFAPAQRFGTIVVPPVYDPNVLLLNGTTLISNNTSSGGVIDGAAGSSYQSFNMGKLTVRNLTVRTYQNPQISGINAYFMFQLVVENVVVDTGVYNVNAIEPMFDRSGIVTPKNSNCAETSLNKVSLQGYMHGLKAYEHTNADNLNIQSCKNALSLYFASHSSNFNRCNFQRNTVQVNVVEEHIFNITQLNMEYAGVNQTTPENAWQATQWELYDPNNAGVANIHYANVKGALGAVTTFRMNGGSNIVVKRFGNENRITSTIPSP